MSSKKNPPFTGVQARIVRIGALPTDPLPLSLEDVQGWPGVGRVEQWHGVASTVLALPAGSYDYVWVSEGELPTIPPDQEIVASGTMSGRVYLFTVNTSRLPAASTLRRRGDRPGAGARTP